MKSPFSSQNSVIHKNKSPEDSFVKTNASFIFSFSQFLEKTRTKASSLRIGRRAAYLFLLITLGISIPKFAPVASGNVYYGTPLVTLIDNPGVLSTVQLYNMADLAYEEHYFQQSLAVLNIIELREGRLRPRGWVLRSKLYCAEGRMKQSRNALVLAAAAAQAEKQARPSTLKDQVFLDDDSAEMYSGNIAGSDNIQNHQYRQNRQSRVSTKHMQSQDSYLLDDNSADSQKKK